MAKLIFDQEPKTSGTLTMNSVVHYIASNQETATFTITAVRPQISKKDIFCFLGPNKFYQRVPRSSAMDPVLKKFYQIQAFPHCI
jgi:hypothetical protein